MAIQPKGTDPRRLRLLLLLLVVIGGVTLWPRARTEAPSAVRAEAGRRPGTASEPPPIPTLWVVDGIAGKEPVVRNPFGFYVPPTKRPTPVPPTPTPVPNISDPRFIGPLPIPPTPTNTPIIPPPIPYKLMGIFGPKDRPIVALEEGTRLINAREGDTVDGRFIIKKINRESVDMAFTGLPPEITRRLPLAQQTGQ